MPVRRTHRIAALGLSASLLLAGCGGSDEEAVIEDAAAEIDEQLDESAEESSADVEPEAEAASDDTEDSAGHTEEADEIQQLPSGAASKVGSVPDVPWTEIEESPETVLEAPGVRLRVTQTAQVDELSAEIAAEVAMAYGQRPARPADGETFLIATLTIEDAGWAHAEAESEGEFRVAGNPVPNTVLRGGSGERQQTTYVVSVPEGASPEDAVAELVTDDVVQQISLIDGTRVNSDVEHIYQAGTEVTVDGEGYSQVFDSWASGTHEINGQVTGAVISPYVEGWARPGQVFLGVDIDARDDTGVDDDITTIQLELADGSTLTPENDFSSLINRFDETAWFQVPADSEQITLHLNPMGKAGTKEIDFESPIEVTLTIEGGPTDGADSGDQVTATEGPGTTDETTATQEPGSTD
ncbi:DNA polymerase V family protein [Ornithinimicrobium faecis]|uniref:DNA polymerase V family protein n=1 Tax=Ornithinimicrobium faecis TaxID=2934158 RepID=A0ABY4YSJ2_9MICO|nr:DNA polymerase V family protein [Ornithinimicrobium sp. HY1793]USQ79694.1 DNA polymerase V family protein [Ornithinimicrobium sp. HY1793]